jgi:hypothetical protein
VQRVLDADAETGEAIVNNEWLQSLKAGDKVLVSSYGGEEVVTITRVTATQLIIARGLAEYRYRKADGRRVGDDVWHPSRLFQATPEKIAAIMDARKRAALRHRLNDRLAKPDDIPTADLEAAWELLKPKQEARNG